MKLKLNFILLILIFTGFIFLTSSVYAEQRKLKECWINPNQPLSPGDIILKTTTWAKMDKDETDSTPRETEIQYTIIYEGCSNFRPEGTNFLYNGRTLKLLIKSVWIKDTWNLYPKGTTKNKTREFKQKKYKTLEHNSNKSFPKYGYFELSLGVGQPISVQVVDDQCGITVEKIR